MNPPQLDEAAIFNAARLIQEPESHQLCLDEACANDPNLRARIEALLGIHDQRFRHPGAALPGWCYPGHARWRTIFPGYQERQRAG
jgi:hypothetical protein